MRKKLWKEFESSDAQNKVVNLSSRVNVKIILCLTRGPHNKKKVNKVKSKAAKKMTLDMEKSINSLHEHQDENESKTDLSQFKPDRKSLRALELEMINRESRKTKEGAEGEPEDDKSDNDDDWDEAL